MKRPLIEIEVARVKITLKVGDVELSPAIGELVSVLLFESLGSIREVARFDYLEAQRGQCCGIPD